MLFELRECPQCVRELNLSLCGHPQAVQAHELLGWTPQLVVCNRGYVRCGTSSTSLASKLLPASEPSRLVCSLD